MTATASADGRSTGAVTGHPAPSPPDGQQRHEALLIEHWLPINELGIEGGKRENWPRPPLNQFHVWWARRPLAPCSGVQLAATLPPFSDDLVGSTSGLRAALDTMRARRPDLFKDGATPGDDRLYEEWIVWLAGIWGDVKGTYKRLELANKAGTTTESYTWRPAYNNSPPVADLAVLQRLLVDRWGRMPSVLDPTAGGGAIPFTAQRFGMHGIANDLNPVAAEILEVCLLAASEYGTDLLDDIQQWGETLAERAGAKLAPYFELEDNDENVTAYIHAHTVACPRTGGPIPLSPSWWLDKSGRKWAARLTPVYDADGSPSHIGFEVVAGDDIDFDPKETGTITRGTATSPWDGLVVDSDYIKAEAQAGRMWETPYAVSAWKPKKGRGKNSYVRELTDTDRAAMAAASDALAAAEQGRWASDDVLPNEPIPDGQKTAEARRYGMTRWRDMFNDRQLLTQGTFVETWRELVDEVRNDIGDRQRADAVLAVLAMMQNKALNYNARLCVWHITRGTIANLFSRHDFAFAWSHGEFEGANALFPWCLDQVATAYEKIAGLLEPTRSNPDAQALSLDNDDPELDFPVPGPATISKGSATDLPHLADGSVECVNIDPPYYDNVMYAELADFFYVWEKRTLGVLNPERFADELTDKDNEAVANPSRFDFAKKRKNQLATSDYESKMRDIFEESRRVLRDDGVLVVWFTHKKAEAWNTLGAALMDAGFTIETSWPINTESPLSLHQANVNAAKSTLVLVCRKRPTSPDSTPVFFEDIEAEMRAAARNAVARFESVVGHGGVDLLLSTYGPTLSVLSSHWPVLSSEADAEGNAIPLRPEEALAVARTEVSKLRLARLVGREERFDPTTDFVLIAWDTYRAKGFPYDEARKLALGVGSDVDQLIGDKVLTKKSGNVELAGPLKRVPRRIDEDGPFASLYDAICVMLRKYELDGAAAVRTWLVERGFDTPGPFRLAVSAYGAAVPRVRAKDGWELEEARLLDELAANVPTLELSLPEAEDARVSAEQQSMDV